MEVPTHVAIILDGNGRWAKSKGLPRKAGHVAGAKNVEPTLRAADALGIKYVTMYAFSTENWNRPNDEVAALMNLLEEYLVDCKKRAANDNMRVRVIGDISKLSESMQEKIKDLEDYTKNFTGLNFQIALNYGSRDEMIRAMKKMYQDIEDGKISKEDISETCYSGYLDTADIPDPDLMIRTSGEQRLSNYLLWQFAYSEFYFTDVAWPDFNKDELKKAVEAYGDRNRRYGKL